MAATPQGQIAHKSVLDHVGGFLYLATSDTAGPYDGGAGEVHKLDIASGTWTRITPEPGAGWGYAGLTIDRQNPSTIMAGLVPA